jgi:hypothetical protein
MNDPVSPSEVVSLTEPLVSPSGLPVKGVDTDIGKLQKLGERTLANRTRLLDRFNQLPLYGKPRKRAEDNGGSGRQNWRLEGNSADHPLVQMVLSLRLDEDELMEKEEFKDPESGKKKERYVMEMFADARLKLKLSIKTKIADLLISLQRENDQVFKELQAYIEHQTHKEEHKDKMEMAGNKRLDELSDFELLKLANGEVVND